MQIMITERLRVRQEDSSTFAMEELVTVAATAKAPEHTRWVRLGWYGTLDGCCERAVMWLLAQRDETRDVQHVRAIVRETAAFVRETFGREKLDVRGTITEEKMRRGAKIAAEQTLEDLRPAPRGRQPREIT